MHIGLMELCAPCVVRLCALVCVRVCHLTSTWVCGRLFEEYPYMQSSFNSFKGLTSAALRKDRTMYSHALTVMYSIGSLVDNLDDPDQLVLIVTKMANNHLARDVGLRYFEVRPVVFAVSVVVDDVLVVETSSFSSSFPSFSSSSSCSNSSCSSSAFLPLLLPLFFVVVVGGGGDGGGGDLHQDGSPPPG